nr:glycosyltransferase family 39 protein [Planosporangium thailandense]
MLLAAVGLTPTEALLRLPTAVAAVAAVTVTAACAASWFGPRRGPRVAVIAGVLLATHPLFVFYAHDARPYTIAVLLTVVASGALISALSRPSPLRLAAYALAAVLAIYAHMFAGLVVAAHALVVVRHGVDRRRWLVTGAAVAAAVAPLAWIGSHQTGELGWIPKPTPAAVVSVLGKLAGGAEAVPLAALAVLVVATLRARRRPWPAGVRGTLLIGWAVLPPALLVLADFGYPVLVARYALVAVPAMAVAAAGAAVWLNNRAAAALLALTVASAVATTVYQQAQPFKYEDFRAATDAIEDSSRPGDAIVFLPSAMRVGYDQYSRSGFDDGRGPVDVALAPGDGPLIADLIGGVELAPDRVRRAVADHQRVFVVGDGPPQTMARHRAPQDRAKVAALRDGYVLAWARRFGVVTVSLFTRPGATLGAG